MVRGRQRCDEHVFFLVSLDAQVGERDRACVGERERDRGVDFMSSKSIATVGVTLMYGAKVDCSACLATADPTADDVVSARFDAAYAPRIAAAVVGDVVALGAARVPRERAQTGYE